MEFVKRSQRGNALAIFGLMLGVVAIVLGMLVKPIHAQQYTEQEIQAIINEAAWKASGEFKRNFDPATLHNAAINLVNSYGVSSSGLTVTTCDDVAASLGIGQADMKDRIADLIAADHAPYVCTNPLRKLVRVEIVNPNGFNVTLTAVSEAPSVDLVLAIDSSESMAKGWAANPQTGDASDPSVCNISDTCSPFVDVKNAAKILADKMFYPYDRVSIVTFDKDAQMHIALSGDYDSVFNTIGDLKVFEGNQACPYTLEDRAGNPRDSYTAIPGDGVNPCRLYNAAGQYQYLDCPNFYGQSPDASACQTTNIADGVALSNGILFGDYSSTSLPQAQWPAFRANALPVLVVLGDGPANTAHDVNEARLCPWSSNNYTWSYPLCRDSDTLTRHCWSASDANCLSAPGPGVPYVDQSLYDPDDRARDMFDLVSRNNILIYTIGMGNEITRTDIDINGIAPGEALLKYGAFGTTTDINNPEARVGQYFYANDSTALSTAFQTIADSATGYKRTLEPTPTPTIDPNMTGTLTYVATLTSIPARTATKTATSTPTATHTRTLTPTKTPTKTNTLTATVTKTKTSTPAKVTFKSINTFDGWLLEDGEKSNVAGTMDSTGTSLVVGDDVHNNQYRSILSFHTGPLPNNAIIKSATISIRATSIKGVDPFSVLGVLWMQVKQNAFGTAGVLELADFNAPPSATTNAGTFGSPVNGWYKANLTTTGLTYINPTGTTQFRLRFALDDNNDNKANAIYFISGDALANQPELTITYTVP